MRQLGRVDYATTWADMRAFTDARRADTADELWVCEHESVYTLGQAARREHILNPGGIPVVQSDRGGQVTWHGPGQIVLYTLIDLRRAGFGVRSLVTRIETAITDCLEAFDVAATARPDAPGVYVLDDHGEPGAKIAALGLRVRRGASYHGLSLNVCPDLTAFHGIDPCGHVGMEVTSLAARGVEVEMAEVVPILLQCLHARLSADVT